MPWLFKVCMHIFFSDILHFDMSLLLLTVTPRGYLISIAYCLFFHFAQNIYGYKLYNLLTEAFLTSTKNLCFRAIIRKYFVLDHADFYLKQVCCVIYNDGV